MLVIQIGAILFGGYGVYVYCRNRTTLVYAPFLVLLQFYLMWGIYSALSFDYHDNVVGAMFLPWFIHYFDRKRYWPAAGFFVLLLISKENMALWGVFISLGCLWRYFPDKQARPVAAMLAIGALGYFLLVTEVWMPRLNTTHHLFAQLIRYQHLGGSTGAIAWNLLTHPQLLVQHLFLNTIGNPDFNYIKAELYGVLLLSGGLSVFFRPWYLLMLVPIMAQKLLTHDFVLWGIAYQYSIEFAPVLALATFDAANRLSLKAQKRYLGLFLVLTLATTTVTLVKRKSKWFIKPLVQFQRPMHYRSLFNREKLHAALQTIPDQVPVSASSCLTPRLVEREKLYHFPVVRDATFIALVKTSEETYPLSPAAYQQKIKDLRQNRLFRITFEDEQVIIFRRLPDNQSLK
jgi:uncharacterized membrane protein